MRSEVKLNKDFFAAKAPADLAAQEAEVAAGGVYFRCDCGAKGVIRAQHALAADARAQLKIAAPAPCGVSIPECPSCAKEQTA